LYGGIELVVDQMARGLVAAGQDITLFTTGDSTCPVPKAWALPHAEGMRIGMAVPELRHVVHAYEIVSEYDVVHDHTVMGPFYAERYPDLPIVTTIHGPFNDELTDLYQVLALRVPIVAISHAQRRAAPDIPIARVIHHGLDASAFPFGDGAGDEDGEFCLFLGRMAPDKGAHRAIEVARKAGMRVLLAAKMREQWERSYFDEQVAPLLGPDAVYLGEVPHEHKLRLLAQARALLFPIRWNEPFGMVMLESMACGTPVLAFPEGAVPEVVEDGKTGFLCEDETAMAEALGRVDQLSRADCRASVEGYFSTERMVSCTGTSSATDGAEARLSSLTQSRLRLTAWTIRAITATITTKTAILKAKRTSPRTACAIQRTTKMPPTTAAATSAVSSTLSLDPLVCCLSICLSIVPPLAPDHRDANHHATPIPGPSGISCAGDRALGATVARVSPLVAPGAARAIRPPG
jgi:glycosyltransferase involved in cell wall biosynthesis